MSANNDFDVFPAWLEYKLLDRYPYLDGNRSDIAPVNSFSEMILVLEIMGDEL